MFPNLESKPHKRITGYTDTSLVAPGSYLIRLREFLRQGKWYKVFCIEDQMAEPLTAY